ncbi:DNA mismatch repair endonuclease MutL [Ochrobactrum sp. MH181795]|jgi:DNA mismatch repair protein MutL|uniref:DNA mismatch repair endonuclease MutL n=1 Tax=Brucella TaxID=234 RepID=UPI0004A6CBD2|nr:MULTISPECIES: DNA mismatch repair endonuclease MutL [Brucella/Ochrobactrum group]RNL47516.1 DNA mismatch repair endonuclease MutL [Ochrobactrum sp. MH181795]KAB2724865.1 DNA mismatch repair endonuclease MutL [Brucella anthropi]KAB2735886.1 DNA mismatch repair endonuclease MutL [Brucella anthropi]KAB2742686.1 DNA mismatch repair endonuclease MutL [Brucella anthropi]KAB2789611.1 DNA mismatch repair endonuclease MutL [Brucella anthropi]
MPIRHLSETIINQIAAGEVIERPASVIKELVENAIDAGATRIEVVTGGGGKTLLRVTDNGSGIPIDELPLAVSRHCTSKLSDDVHDIRALGFRGEALPSIGSVAKLTLKSRPQDADSGFEVSVSGGHLDGPRPSALNRGTIAEVRDLFYATPARLKFMKTDRAEAAAITDVVKRIAIAFPHVRFSLAGTDRTPLELAATGSGAEATLERINQVLGKEFGENALAIDAERDGVRLAGFVGIPSHNRGNALHQFAYVNGRPVRDKQLFGALRGAYADVMARDRHPVAVLFLTLDPALVDVNVHPAKADVRFRDPGLVRGLIVGAIKQALAQSGIRPATSGADAMLQAFRAEGFQPPSPSFTSRPSSAGYASGSWHPAVFSPRTEWSPQTAHPAHRPLDLGAARSFQESDQATLATVNVLAADVRATRDEAPVELQQKPLGAARAQIHANYIVSQTEDSLVIVDQHAAHERLVYEALKNALHSRPIPGQMLLIPEIVDLPEEDAERLATHAETLARFGLGIEQFGPGAIAVRETPAMLGEMNVQQLIRDLSDEIAEHDTSEGLKAMLNHVAATMACHGSVRSGRRLKPEEMNALLREMEATPGSGTCNHGRPTYIELKLTDIERLFGRR